ncbi:hypothetical protein [Streptomyces sp. Wb2n-11]|uniref:hypothetical protein n=1 Tax=Streptomyces sp. Wb2n-11 TaxID=1030533 RepID=UPI000AC72C83|nr:hypothetical protein [Streptomyces sp. Wb2n-11]
MSSPRSTPFAPSVHVRALLTWLAVYPTITLVMVALRPWVSPLPLAVQTLVLTAIVVPVAAYGLLPPLMRMAAALSRRDRAKETARLQS